MKSGALLFWLFLLMGFSAVSQQEEFLFIHIISGYELPGNVVVANKKNQTNFLWLPDKMKIFEKNLIDQLDAIPGCLLSTAGWGTVNLTERTCVKDSSTSFFLFVAVPFWRRWWFILSVAGLLIGVIFGLHRYRLNQLIEMEKLKNTISADLHDDLGTRLTNIQFLSAILKKKLGNDNGERKYLEGIEEEAEASAKALDEIVWNIRMKDENLEEMVARMRAYASDMLENHYNYRTEITGTFSRKKMSMQKRRELFLIYKELLNNVRKHARATEVEIEISTEDHMFLMMVKDNGCGFDPGKKTDRNGLRNIRERVRKWHGNIYVRSEIDKGTLVACRIPYDPRFSAS